MDSRLLFTPSISHSVILRPSICIINSSFSTNLQLSLYLSHLTCLPLPFFNLSFLFAAFNSSDHSAIPSYAPLKVITHIVDFIFPYSFHLKPQFDICSALQNVLSSTVLQSRELAVLFINNSDNMTGLLLAD